MVWLLNRSEDRSIDRSIELMEGNLLLKTTGAEWAFDR
jgi:hypothetical protein